MTDILAALNPEQQTAVAVVKGPVLVLAGPGSGKTRVLTRRIAYLIDEAGVAPWNILAVTFTNKAAGEMRERVERIFEAKFGPPPPGQPQRLAGLTIGTFHSICARILRVETALAGYQRNWVIYDSADQLSLVRAVMREENLDEKRYPPKGVLANISKQKNELVTPEHFQTASYFEEIVRRVYVHYQAALLANNAMDFDDLLMRTVMLLRDNLDVRVKYQEKWRYLLVDEFQDTNAAQYEMLRLLATEPTNNRNILVVGDEDQSIYRFRGADYRNVQLFRRDYPEAKVVLLEQNYRSTQSILDVANALISQNRNRTPKRLRTDNGHGVPVTVYEAYNEVEEAAYVADEIEKLTATRAFQPGDFAIMYRTNAQSRALEEAFVLRGIKYRLVGATRFYERKEIKDALAYLRLIHNLNDTVALERIINEPSRGIGPKTLEGLRTWAGELGENAFVALLIVHHGVQRATAILGRPLPQAAVAGHPFGSRAQNALADFAEMLEEWVAAEQRGGYDSVADLLDQVMARSGYIDTLRDGTDDGEDRFANLQELRAVAAQYTQGMPGLDEGRTPLSLFLEEVSLVSDSDELDDSAGAVTLLTLHTAKGLEYPIVFVVGMEEGILPHSRSLESGDPEDMDEERRLAYVGITRAKKRLYLVHCFRRSLWGGSEVQSPSRFLSEIPADLLAGMVDRASRREASYQRMTSWDNEGSGQRERSQTGGYWSGRSKSSGYNWSSSNEGASRGRGSATDEQQRRSTSSRASYWSPGDGASEARPKRATRQSGGSTQFKRRDSVKHPTFGIGTVIESELTRDGDEQVTVAFPGIGIKKLLVSLAGLVRQ
ncbi:MAG: UvrD-helicase domain-containing protein [Caldilineaceae bacterium]|nr:UvrD-helicase domain-containing protein [Caldilineaceae bacterium]